MTNRETILDFIAHFRQYDQHGEVTKTFTSGCCYWFAMILARRFFGNLVYDPIANHFALEINTRFYDITGEVTGKYNFLPWATYGDEAHKRRIIRDCINMEEEE